MVQSSPVADWWSFGLLWLIWIGAWGGSFLGAPWMLLNLLGAARTDLRRPDVETDERRWLMAGHLWHAALYVFSVLGSTATMVAASD